MLAIEYLQEACEKGHHQANGIVEEDGITSNEEGKQQIQRIFR
jgi:hypothetical protein